MKQLFHIKSRNIENGQQVLSLRLGERHGSFAITNQTGDVLYELAYCLVDDAIATGWNENSLAEFFSAYPVLASSFLRVGVAYDVPNSILTPSGLYKQEEMQQLLTTSYGIISDCHIINELVEDWQLYNTYAVPGEVYKWIHQKFPAATSRHQYSLDVKRMNAAVNGGSLLVDFRKDDFTLLVAKESKLMLAQRFTYTTPDDVIYYLLKTCRQFSLSQKEVELQLSGLIDKDSALYKELYLYIMHVEFREAGWHTGSDYPAHFFTSLNDLAQCAS